MDLLSCPQEMLANVLKYTTFETVTRIRKTSKHMDYVARKTRMSLPRVKIASLVRYGKTDVQIYLEYKMKDIWDSKGNEDVQRLYSTHLTYNQSTVLNVFEETVKAIRSMAYMVFLHGEINSNLVDLLKKLKRREKSSLYIRNCSFAVPMEELRLVLAKYQNKSEIVIKPDNKIMNEPMGNDLIVKFLVPYTGVHLEWSTDDSPRHPALTDESLCVARKCLPHSFQVGYENPFSLSEIKKTMLRLIECFESKERKFSTWHFGCLQLDSKEELNRTVKEILDIPGTKITCQREDFAIILVMTALLSYAGFHYNYLSVDNHFPELTDEVLRVARQHMPHVLNIGCYCPFSFIEIKKTMLHLMEYKKLNRNKSISWKFGSLQMKSKKKLLWAVQTLARDIPGTKINQREELACISYKYGPYVYGKQLDLFLLRLIVR